MDMKKIFGAMVMIIILHLCFSQTVSARDLIVVAEKSAQEMAVNWLAFLQTKEIPYKMVMPDGFGDYKKESYIVIMGDTDKAGEIYKIAGQALSSKELGSIGSDGKGETFFKSNVWAPKQKVILFLGNDLEAADKARQNSKDLWYAMFMDWFDLEGTEGLHMY